MTDLERRRPEAGGAAATGDMGLPYGRFMTRLLRPLQRAFVIVNRGFMAPLTRRGLGWLIGNPLTGHVMLLRTRGRRSGLIREAPLGYVIREGAVYCVAGYGERTPWFQNLLADPRVDVSLPTRRFLGRAEPVTEPAEWLAAYRALIASFGVVGRMVVGDISRLDDAMLLARHRGLPVVRIGPNVSAAPLRPGWFDPGGRGWCVPWASTIALAVVASCTLRHAGRRG